ncbi:glycosyltransferase family 87 protein [Rubripirellula amarantea]|nr:glycosyltransferase family 87 protein [Rubripirellula amarantea]
MSCIERQRFTLGHRLGAMIAIGIFVFGVGLTIARIGIQYQTPGPFDHDSQGLCDFHNGLYFPTIALLKGLSPYGAEYAASYPVARQIPFFSPSILVLHAPFAMMPLTVAEVTFVSLSVIMLLAIAGLVVRSIDTPIRVDYVFAIAALTVFSRGGHITLFDGYFTFELILATFAAIHYGKTKPWLAAIALAVVSAKPTYILPLGFLLLFRGNVRAIVLGAILSVVTTLGPMLWLAHHEGGGDMVHGIETLVDQISQAQEIHRADQDESPIHSWTRIDLLAVIAKWTGDDPKEALHLIVMGIVLAPVLFLLNRRRRQGIDDGLTGLTGALILTAMLVSLYHQSYDSMLMVAPIAGLVLGANGFWRQFDHRTRFLVAALMLLPLYNYFSTRSLIRILDGGEVMTRIFTSLNGVSLAILLVILLVLGLRYTGSPNRTRFGDQARAA